MTVRPRWTHGVRDYSIDARLRAIEAVVIAPKCRFHPEGRARGFLRPVALLSEGWERTANETELLLFRRWFETVHARQEEVSEDTFTESAPPMQSRLIWAVKDPLVQ